MHERLIAHNSTGTDRHRGDAGDFAGSDRNDLLAQLAGSQADLDQVLRSVSDPTAMAQIRSQQNALSGLEARVALARPADLAALRAEVTAYAAASRLAADQAQADVNGGGKQAELRRATQEANLAVAGFMDDYYGRKAFEPYLQFASAEDEEEFRKREAQRKAEMEKALAEKTPEGALRANNLAIDQLEDAGAHGADRSPDYQPMLSNLQQTRKNLAGEIGTVAAASAPIPPDPLADLPDAEVPKDVLAALRSAGIAVQEAASGGHGVNSMAFAAVTSRIPT